MPIRPPHSYIFLQRGVADTRYLNGRGNSLAVAMERILAKLRRT